MCVYDSMYVASKNVVKVGRRRGREQEHARLKKQYYNATCEAMNIIHCMGEDELND